jgi:hypothetical protein
MNEIFVFGEQAKAINEGDTFKASVHHVEGRKVVKLVKVENK